MLHTFTRAELKTKGAGDFDNGDTIHCGKYWIYIRKTHTGNVTLHSTVETFDGKSVPCWPVGARGCWPCYIAEFLGRKQGSEED